MLIISDKFGRLGNNIYQLLNILLEAEERNDNVNLQQLYYLNSIINIQEVEKLFNSTHENKAEVIRHHFMPKDLHLVEKCKVNTIKFFEVAKKYIHPNFSCNMEPLNERICLIHIRCGDAFTNGHIGYVQPPLNYYKKIINDHQDKYDEFRIIPEPDLTNPCIKFLDGYLNKTRIETGTVLNDYTSMLKTQSIILSRSSFSDSTIFLNPNIKNIYFWNYGHNLCDTSIIPKHINYYPYNLIAPYIRVDNWTHSKEQQTLMIEYDIKNIKLNK
jgi:hypothetical protein